MSTEKLNTGRQLSFFKLFTKEDWRVEIPIIQRDFAQGREKNSDLRYTFLNSIYQSLSQNKNPLDLDFVYGNLKGDNYQTFFLLDGQQRLTTLFLLHWYLAHLSKDYNTFFKVLSTNNKSRFTYQLRSSSEEFCDFLINRKAQFLSLDELLAPDINKNNGLSKTLRNEAHFLYSWDFDPTVQSMLNMLDSIHEIFYTKNAKQFFGHLINESNPGITFNFFNLQDFKLTDDLYIKMNSRGVQLTPFENFKSWLQDRVEENKIIIDQKEWKHKIDVEWTNLFWERRENNKNIIDIAYYRFFKNMGLYFMVIPIDDKNINDENRKILDAVRLDSNLSFLDYERNNFFSKDSLNFIFSVLDAIKLQGINNIENWLSTIATKTFLNERIGDLLLSEKNTPTRPDSVFLYAMIIFIIEEKAFFNEDKIKNFQEWMRLCRNLIYNTPIDTPQRYVSAIQSINNLAPYKDNIYNYVLKNDSDVLGTFLTLQREEEKQKIKLIESSREWKEKIIKLENHQYLYGNISIILKFGASDNEPNFDKFKFYGDRISKLFNQSFRDHKDKLLQRAILTKGAYFPKVSRNHTYCLPTSGTLRDRNENWRRFFDSENNIFLKEVIDEFLQNDGDIEQQLQNAINSSTQTDWKKFFIEEPAILNYCKNGMIRWNSDDEIFLMKTTRIYGRHAELRSFSFYIKYVKSNPEFYMPFHMSYFENAMAPYHPFIKLDCIKLLKYNFEIEISYESEKNQYNFYFYEEDGKEIKETKILNILSDFKMKDKPGFGVVFEKNYNSQNSLSSGLQNSLIELNKLF